MTTAVRSDSLRLLSCTEPIIDRVYQERWVPRRDLSRRPLEIYIPREEGNYLYSLVRWLRPQVTVEVGMANGLSTLFIASGLRDNGYGRHIAIDPFQSSDWVVPPWNYSGRPGLIPGSD